MSFDPLSRLTAPAILLPRADIDTDQIFPGRFLSVTTRAAAGAHLFHDWRFAADGSLRTDSPFDGPAAREARILVAGANFGCGSSREHAVWALHAFGIRAVLSPRIAGIFRANAIGAGVLAGEIDAHFFDALAGALTAAPDTPLTVDLKTVTVALPDGRSAPFEIAPFDRQCLLTGRDKLDILVDAEAEIAAFEARHPAP
jgi:3-isopropylmalate/(R)-2-methylmalate dehydratase small subunit